MAHALLDGVVQQHRFLGSERLLEGRNHASLENRPLLHPGKSLLGLGATKTEKIDRRLRDGGSIFGTKEEKHLNEMLGVTSEKDGIGRKLKLWMVCVRDQIQPQGDSHNDDSLDQRVLNVVTSLPFLALGGYMMRKHKTKEGKSYGKSMMGVGVGAILYHASAGQARRICRKIDYYTISLATGRMVRALWPESKALKKVVRASLVTIPFKPFVLSTAYTVAMQAEFIRKGLQDDSLKPYMYSHVGAAALGGCAFAMEDQLCSSSFKHMHAVWHMLCAYGVYTTSKLVQHREKLQYENISVHDSASSLVDLNQSIPKMK